MAVRLVALACAALVLGGRAEAQPGEVPPVEPVPPMPPPAPPTPSEALRAGNAAATAGDWIAVGRLVDPLLRLQLLPADLGEAHRLGGLAAFFQGRRADAEHHFLSYLRIDLDAQLDPALYPVEAIIFFNDVKAKHAAELRARRPKGKSYWVLNLLPPWGQFQNGDRTKGFIIGGTLGAFIVANATTFVLLRTWCTESDLTCDDPSNHVQGARTARTINILTGIGAWITYGYGVLDGALGYRRRQREIRPIVTTTHDGGFIGVAGAF